MNKLSSILFIIGAVLNSTAQSDLSAKEAVVIALENNYQVQIAELQQLINEKNNSWSEAGMFPTVSLSVGNNNTIQDNTNNPFTFTPGIILSQSLNPSLNANWNIFSGFAVRISKTRLEQLEEQSSNNAMAVIETTIQDVLKAYYTAKLQEERKELFRTVMELSQEKFKYYQLKEQYSGTTSLESLQFRNQYLTDSTNYLLQEISYKNSLRNLFILMNDSTRLDIDVNLTDQLELAIKEVDLASAKDEMLTNNKNLKNQYINLELQKTGTNLRRSFLYPTLSFQAGVNPGWNWIREIKDDLFEAETNSLAYYGNLNLRYTIFDNFKNSRAVQVAKIQEEIAQLNVESMEQTLSSTLENLIELYTVREDLVNISSENVEYAKRALELAQRRFDLGTINSIDLASFQNSYENTMIQHLENLYNKLDTYLEIYKLTGKIGLDYTN
ncbi:MAG: TolC family protein [Crocinitomicaceae bacterium]